MNEAKQIHMNPLTQTAQEIITAVKELMVERPVTTKDAADYMGLHPKSLIKQISKGVFPAQLVHRSGGRHYFFLSEIRDYLKAQ